MGDAKHPPQHTHTHPGARESIVKTTNSHVYRKGWHYKGPLLSIIQKKFKIVSCYGLSVVFLQIHKLNLSISVMVKEVGLWEVVKPEELSVFMNGINAHSKDTPESCLPTPPCEETPDGITMKQEVFLSQTP